MKAIQVQRFGKALKVANFEIPKIKNANQVLLKVLYAPINPSDVYYSRGIYGIRLPLPSLVGFEGVGEIQGSGQIVGFLSSKDQKFGSWSQYCVVDKNNLMTVQCKKIEQAACAMVNPMTAMGFLHMARNFKNVLFSSKVSAVSQMAIRLMQNENKNVLGLERNKPYKNEFKEPVIFFDSFGGNQAGEILNQLPEGSTLVNYGSSSGGYMGKINPQDLIFRKKQLRGFWLDEYLEEISEKERLEQMNYVGERLDEGETFYSEIHKIYKLDEIDEALQVHQESRGKGKILLQMH